MLRHRNPAIVDRRILVGLTNWLGQSDGLRHVASYDAVGIRDAFMSPSQPPWAHVPAYQRSTPANNWNVTNWLSPSDGLQHIGFVDGSGHVQDLFTPPGGPSPTWALYDVTNDTGTPG